MRPLTIRSRYEEAECSACGATITIDADAEGGPAEISGPEDHNDDCPLAHGARRFTHDVIISNQRMEIERLKRELEQALLTRGRHVAALEQIRSAPLAHTSWRERYERCVAIVNEALSR